MMSTVTMANARGDQSRPMTATMPSVAIAARRGIDQTPNTARLKSRCPARNRAGPPSTVATVSGLACPNGWAITNSSPTAVTMIPATIGMWR